MSAEDNVDLSSMTEEERERYERKKAKKLAKKLAKMQEEEPVAATPAASADDEEDEAERERRKAEKKAAKKRKQEEEEAAAAAAAASEQESKKSKKSFASSSAAPSASGLKKNFYKLADSLKNFTQYVLSLYAYHFLIPSVAMNCPIRFSLSCCRSEVEAYRAQHSMAISGQGSEFPNYKPARNFGKFLLAYAIVSLLSVYSHRIQVHIFSYFCGYFLIMIANLSKSQKKVVCQKKCWAPPKASRIRPQFKHKHGPLHSLVT
jgi:cobalamin biosynthesis Mg chelatase CobN